MKKSTIVGLVTFGVFMTEAIIQYNIGKNGDKKDKKFILPPSKDLLKLAITVGVFSYLNGVIIGSIINGKAKV
jgi:hypothetical protein